MTIDNYFIETEKIISDFDIVISQKIEKKKTDDNFGILKGLLYFEKNKLDFIEVIRINSSNIIKIKYKYHFMTNKNKMIFRYDNVKHHQQISTFPHHKHLPNDIISSIEPNFLTILLEIKEYQKNEFK